jgi:hypothetical protein
VHSLAILRKFLCMPPKGKYLYKQNASLIR